VNRVNPTVVFLACTALVLVALFVPGPLGGVLLLLVAAVAGALLVGTWDRIPPIGRVARIAVLALVLLLAISRFR
jgi:uncharacterized protein DUF6703